MQDRLDALLIGCDFPEHAAIARSLMGESAGLPAGMADSEDPEIRFGTALVTGDIPRLTAALDGDPLSQMAAGMTLARLGHFAPLENLLRTANDGVRDRVLVQMMWSEKPAPGLRDVLLDLVERPPHKDIASLAARVLARGCDPKDAVQMVRAANGDTLIINAALKAPLARHEVVDIFDFLIATGQLRWYTREFERLQAWLPNRYVEDRFPQAPDDDTRDALCRLACEQLRMREDDKEIEPFLVRTAFAGHSPAIRDAAWTAMIQVYNSRSGGGQFEPVSFKGNKARRCFGSIDKFARRYAAAIEDPEVWAASSFSRSLGDLLFTTDPRELDEGLAWTVAEPVLRVMLNVDAPSNIRRGGARFLARMAAFPEWSVRATKMIRQLDDTDMHDLIGEELGYCGAELRGWK